MDPRKLSELHPFLREHNLAPKRTLSQNFLIDANILRKIVETANVQPGEPVLEIGPGPGGLTKTLIEKGASVLAIEKDRNFAKLLPTILPNEPLTVVEADILDYPFQKPMKIVANIPYHITSPIITRLAEYPHLFTEIYLTVQKDMALRMFAIPGRENNAFAIFVAYHFHTKLHFDISPSCFYPKPKVLSSLISLTTRTDKPFLDSKPFFELVDLCFQKRRKMIRAIIRHPKVTSEARPEDLTLDEFFTLYHTLQS